jgi:hypothetical protein
MIFKNGIAVGYFEGLSLAERMESGFNFYYTFREGETAWIYTRTLNVFHHLLNVTSFSIDPYQVGHENEEGIESGAFWFYRKLGFRSTNRAVQGLTEKEEQKIAARKSYRTSPKTLRQLAVSPMIFELDQSKAGDWDNFQIRKIGLAVQRKMASSGSGDAVRFREMARDKLCESLQIKRRTFSEDQAFSDFAVVLSLVADLDRWSPAEKKGVLEIIQAKVGDDEIRYLKLLQSHQRLRNEIIKLGSQDI